MKINEVEQLVSISKKNIRFYEKEGLLSPSRNSDNGYRDYSQADVERLKRIKLLRKLALPLDQIRLIQEDKISAGYALSHHSLFLQHEAENLSHAQSLCRLIMENGEELSSINADKYLLQMEEMEHKGVSFVNIQKKDTGRKYIGPIGIAVTTVLLMCAFLGFMLWSFAKEQPPVLLMVLLIVLPVLIAIGVIAALVQRIKEIKGGEEDAANKY